MMGARRFKHFQENLGIAKNTLTRRLNQLVDSGILKKVDAIDGYAHEEYSLTERGRELAPVIIALAQWGDRWVSHERGPASVITVRETDEPLPRIWPRDQDGQELPLEAVGMRLTEGAAPLPWHNTQELAP